MRSQCQMNTLVSACLIRHIPVYILITDLSFLEVCLYGKFWKKSSQQFWRFFQSKNHPIRLADSQAWLSRFEKGSYSLFLSWIFFCMQKKYKKNIEKIQKILLIKKSEIWLADAHVWPQLPKKEATVPSFLGCLFRWKNQNTPAINLRYYWSKNPSIFNPPKKAVAKQDHTHPKEESLSGWQP